MILALSNSAEHAECTPDQSHLGRLRDQNFEFNKIAGACLGILLLVMSFRVISGAVFSRPNS